MATTDIQFNLFHTNVRPGDYLTILFKHREINFEKKIPNYFNYYTKSKVSKSVRIEFRFSGFCRDSLFGRLNIFENGQNKLYGNN